MARVNDTVGGGPPVILLLVGDLMLATRIEAAGSALGYIVRTLDDPKVLPAALDESEPAAVVLDLTSPAFPTAETLAALRGTKHNPRVLGFFPHVMADIGRAAREAGCDIVVPRSRFVSDLPNLLRQAVCRMASPARETTRGRES